MYLKNKIMLEIAKFCDTCGSHDCCPEDECILYRIEKLIINKNKKRISKNKYNRKK